MPRLWLCAACHGQETPAHARTSRADTVHRVRATAFGRLACRRAPCRVTTAHMDMRHSRARACNMFFGGTLRRQHTQAGGGQRTSGRAVVLEGRSVYPHGRDVVWVRMHVARERKLNLGAIGKPQVGVAQLLQQRLQVVRRGHRHVDGEALQAVRGADALELRVVLRLRELGPAAGVELKPLEQPLERVGERAVPVGRPMTAEVLKVGLQPLLHITLEIVAILLRRPPVLERLHL
mmetsp:Transcript_42456/g.111745  ORF Transcript_42456/g.111745 Transcript_42456/m.111745 type:complete len:235 (+) Transcript_42456:130-834(+)